MWLEVCSIQIFYCFSLLEILNIFDFSRFIVILFCEKFVYEKV